MPEVTESLDSETDNLAARRQSAPKAAKKIKAASDLWGRPIDLSPALATRLLHGLAESHRQRLALFAHYGERVSMHALLAITGDTDLRALSYFQGALSRKLRRLLADEERKIHLIGWDYTTTKWDDAHARIVDGVCYVTKATRESLMKCLGEKPERDTPEAR